jgi:hypothetical protein
MFLLAVGAQAATIPFSPELEDALNVASVKKTAHAVFNTAQTGYGSSTTDSGVHGLGVYLPASALILRSYIYVETQMVDNGSGTVAYHCEDANNVKTATDMTGSAAGAFIEGASTGAVSAAVASIANRCEIKATVAGADLSAGKHHVFVDYVVP